MRDAIAPVAGSVRSSAPIVVSATERVLMDARLGPASLWIEPPSMVSLASEIGVSGLTFAELWICSEPSSATSIAGFGGKNLTPLASTSAAVPGQPAIGLFGGVNFKSLRAIEVVDSAGYFRAPATTDLDPGTADFGVLIAFRVAQRAAAQTAILGKATASHAAGFALYLETDGTLTWRVRGTGGDRTVALTGNHADGAWHFVAAYRSGTTIGVFSDITAQATTSGASTDVTSAGAYFTIGASAAASGAWQQTKLAGILTGAEIAGQRTAMLAWWAARVTKAPTVVGSATFTRSSPLSSQVDEDSEGGALLSIAASGAPAAIYMPSDDGDYGLEFAPAFTSIVQYSDPSDSAGWTSLNSATVTAQAANDPRGVRHAVAIGKTASSPTGRRSIGVALTSGTIYHFAMAVRWDGTGPSAPRLRLRNPADSSTVAEVVVTEAGRWHIVVTPTYTAATSDTYLLQILASAATDDTAGGVLVQYVSGGVGASYQPIPYLARGASVANVVTALSITGDEGMMGRGAAGRLETTSKMIGAVTTLPATRTMAALRNGSMARYMDVSTARNVRTVCLDDAGGSDATLSAFATVAELTAVRKYGASWTRTAPSGTPGIAVFIDGAVAATALATIDASRDPTDLVIGGLTAGTVSWLGGISRVRVYAIPWITAPAIMV